MAVAVGLLLSSETVEWVGTSASTEGMSSRHSVHQGSVSAEALKKELAASPWQEGTWGVGVEDRVSDSYVGTGPGS